MRARAVASNGTIRATMGARTRSYGGPVRETSSRKGVSELCFVLSRRKENKAGTLSWALLKHHL